MDNAQKAIMIGVGLFITIIVIAAVMLITGMGQDLLNSGTQQLGNISSQLQSQLTQEFDNKTMTGAQVLAAVKQYYNSTDIGIEVNTGVETSYCGAMCVGSSRASGKDYNYWVDTVGEFKTFDSVPPTTSPAVMQNKVPLSNYTDVTINGGKNYIAANTRWKSFLIHATNDESSAIVGIYFEKQ